MIAVLLTALAAVYFYTNKIDNTPDTNAERAEFAHDHEPDLKQQGSPVYADNGEDVSYLYSDGVNGPDNVIKACDYTFGNNRWTAGRAYNRETDTFMKTFDGVPGGQCAINFDLTKNREWHQTGTIQPFDYDFSTANWGPRSYH